MSAGWRLSVAYLLTILSSSSMIPIISCTGTESSVGNFDRCGGRLERALDALQRDSPRRNRLDEEDAGIVYQQKLVTAPLEMTVSRIAVKLPQDSRHHGGIWARVERCSYEPNNNALQTRVMFNDLSVSGIISLLPRDHRVPIPAESCRMSLRLRRAGIEFYTSPIARGRGQMRIRTESSFLEPRFASIYAYGCRPTRADKQIKRHDKWAHQHQHIPSIVTTSSDDTYEAAEPREIASITKEEEVTIANESIKVRAFHDSDEGLGIWRKNIWITKIPRRRKRRRSIDDKPKNSTNSSSNVNSSVPVSVSDHGSSSIITPDDFVRNNVEKSSTSLWNDDVKNFNSTKNSLKRETTLSQLLYHPVADRHEREFADNNYFDQSLSDEDTSSRNDDWQSRDGISSEMEDVFLRGASQALTRYIERELHPAIKETLMLSMGYTISYG